MNNRLRGSYLIIIKLEDNKKLKIGMLGKIDFKKGYYVYVGSAMNGLEKRIQRHLRKKKKIHWHIDYLLNHARIINIFFKLSNNKQECKIAKLIEEKLLAIKGVGCSDCKCISHLFYGSYEEVKNTISNLHMTEYLLNKIIV